MGRFSPSRKVSDTGQKRLRLACRDLAAGAAFGAMAISGALPTWMVALFAGALIFALWNWRALGERTLLTVFILAVGALLLYSAAAADKLDLVVAACTFAALMTLSRIHATPSPAADAQVHLSSLLMIAGGAALSAEMLFALFLIAFALLTATSLGLQTIQSRGSTEPEAVVAAMRQLLFGAAFAILGCVVFFAVFPRLSWNLASRRGNRLQGALMGFADPVRPRGNGRIKSNPRLVARITVTPDPGVKSLNAYWMGRAFSQFDGREWSSPDETAQIASRVTIRRAERLLHQDVELLPAYGSPALIAIERPAMFGNARVHLENGQTVPTWLRQFGETHVRFVENGVGYSYQAYSTAPLEGTPEDEALDVDVDPQPHLQLPASLDPRVGALAAEVLGSEKDPLRAAHKLEAYLKRGYRYSLELSDAADPLADFLFQRKAGHCEDFATALAVLLRTQGIPSRVAIGFYGGERVGNQYVLRAGDAHSWTQVLVPTHGFVTVDATPEAHRAAQPSAALGWLTPLYDFLDVRWRTWVVDYSFKDQAGFARSLAQPSWGLRIKVPKLNWQGLGIVAAVSIGITACLLAGVSRRRKPADAASVLLERVERALRRVGLQLEKEDLEGATLRLARERHPIIRELLPITRRYLEVRFGGRSLRDGEAASLARGFETVCDQYRRAYRTRFSMVQLP